MFSVSCSLDMGSGSSTHELAATEAMAEALAETLYDADTYDGEYADAEMPTTWSGACSNLVTGVLRGEWGCGGVIISDNSAMSFTYMSGADGILAGSTIFDATTGIEYKQLLEYTDDPVVVSAMREAVHRLAHATLYSAAMNGIGDESTVTQHDPWFLTSANVARAVSVVAAVVFVGLSINASARYRRANPKPKKRDYALG